MTEPQNTARSRRIASSPSLAAACVASLAGLAAVYGIGGTGRNDGACQAAVETARRMAPFARGEVAAVAVATEGRPMPALAFHDDSGANRTLADWRGRTVLLNLWATWCVPCRKEMPALDALQAKLGGPGFEVVAVNIDTRNPDKPKAWLKEVGIHRPRLLRRSERQGVPGPQGDRPRVRHADDAAGRSATAASLATIAGPAEWASDDAVKLVEAALGR